MPRPSYRRRRVPVALPDPRHGRQPTLDEALAQAARPDPARAAGDYRYSDCLNSWQKKHTWERQIGTAKAARCNACGKFRCQNYPGATVSAGRCQNAGLVGPDGLCLCFDCFALESRSGRIRILPASAYAGKETR